MLGGKEKMKMTYDEYDEMLDVFQNLSVKTYYPDPVEIAKMEENPDKWIKFVCYLYEKGKKPQNQKERYSRENLKGFIEKYLVLEDSFFVNVFFDPTPYGKIEFADEGNSKREIGSRCTVSIIPNEGYTLTKAYVLDGLFQKKCLYELDHTLSFIVPEMDVILCAEFKEVL